MSAISAIYSLYDDPLMIEHGRNLMQALRKYPADDIQTLHKGNVFMGCHAQWITPESVGEQLPYYDYERQLAITADAIIDNRVELFEKLQIYPTTRKIMTDSELILLAYDEWGDESPKHLVGDFAFMIWDEKNNRFFAARDFSGSRTLYYYRKEQKFAFCTTIKPLLQLPFIEKKLNEQWVAEFLAIPGMVDAVDIFSTVYKDIEQLPPSHTISVVDGKVRISRYSRIRSEEQLKLKSNEEYEEAFRDVFQQAVTSRLRTYGKVGAQLSGGLDSGSVVSFAARALREENKRLHTFSYIPEEDFIDWTPNHYTADETPFIKATVDYVGNITDHYFDFEGKSPLTELDEFLDMMEMPYKFFGNSFWLKGINEQANHQGIKVLLNGSRGNYSISWGSRELTINYYASLLKRMKWIRLFQELDLYCKNFRTGKTVMIPIAVKKAFPFISRMFTKTNLNNYQFQSFINPLFAERTNVYHKLKEYDFDITGASVNNPNEFRKKHFEQLYFWNKSGSATTRLSLHYSLWDRDPTNDLRVIRFCLALPEQQYVQGGLERSLIRRVTKGYLPDKVRLNQHSRGIQGSDVIHRLSANWHMIIEELEQLTRDPRACEMFDVEVVKNVISKIGNEPSPEYVFNDEFKNLTRSLIVYRFIKDF